MSSNDNEMNYRCSIYRLLPRDIRTNTSDQNKIWREREEKKHMEMSLPVEQSLR